LINTLNQGSFIGTSCSIFGITNYVKPLSFV